MTTGLMGTRKKPHIVKCRVDCLTQRGESKYRYVRGDKVDTRWNRGIIDNSYRCVKANSLNLSYLVPTLNPLPIGHRSLGRVSPGDRSTPPPYATQCREQAAGIDEQYAIR